MLDESDHIGDGKPEPFRERDSHSPMMIEAGPDYDKMWAQQMITHHQGAIDMAQKALTDAARPETKALAQRIIDAQKQEQTQLRAWIQAWGG